MDTHYEEIENLEEGIVGVPENDDDEGKENVSVKDRNVVSTGDIGDDEHSPNNPDNEIVSISQEQMNDLVWESGLSKDEAEYLIWSLKK